MNVECPAEWRIEMMMAAGNRQRSHLGLFLHFLLESENNEKK